jgi:glycosyltransferase involved in cell wall biosynthesis
VTVQYRTIALPGCGFVNWGGGIDFLRSCVNALHLRAENRKEKLVLVLPDAERQTVGEKAVTLLKPFKTAAENLLEGRKPLFQRQKPFSPEQLADSFRNVDHGAEIVFYRSGRSLQSVVREVGAHAVIPSAVPLGRSFPVPWVGYLYDFQHKYYPGYFSEEEYRVRDAHMARMLREARAVIVNSQSAKADVDRFHPGTECKVFSLPFSAAPIVSWFDAPASPLAETYSLPEAYFMICNQFWIHKDHATAFRALAAFIRMTGRQDVHVVCTGTMEDYRHPGYLEKLRSEIGSNGLEKKIHFLGHIPKQDQIAILRGSIAVLQPTLFEGGPGGGAVYDAVAMGVPAVLSDIPVNLEIRNEDSLFYFKAGSAESMAAGMAEAWETRFERPAKDALLSRGRARTAAYGTALRDAMDYVTERS